MAESRTFSNGSKYFPGIQNIDDDVILVYKWAVIVVTCHILDLFGVITNIINIICFIKQGFSEPINVSLFGLAVCDLFSLVTLILMSHFYILEITEADMPLLPLEVAYLVCALPHFVFTRVCAWFTAIITMERCVCIVYPLKVKRIFTARKVTVILLCTFVILISTEAPVYFVNKLDMKFSAAKNRSLLGLVVTQDRGSVQKVTFTINSFILPLFAFGVIIICTTILVISLNRRADWRQQSTKATEVSGRNQKVGKMVVMISSLFICCFIPCAIAMLTLAFEPDFGLGGKYFNIGIVVFGLGLVTESINSSTNIFIYYQMSSKYRIAFHTMFLPCSRAVTEY